MHTPLIAPHPFGSDITVDTLNATFTTLRQWEDRYRQLILLGKKLPPLPEALKTDDIALSGCENRVWLGHQQRDDGRLHFFGDSEGRIVRGLLAVILTAVEGKTPAELLQSDPLQLLEQLGLKDQLSASRGAGMQSLADAVLRAAREA